MEKFENVVLFSGGIDSTTVAEMLAFGKGRTALLHFNMGVSTQTECADLQAKRLGLPLYKINVTDIMHTLKDEDSEFINGYRMFLYTIAMAFADKRDAGFLYTGELARTFGWQAEDPDEKEFFNGFLGVKPDEIHENWKNNKDNLAKLYCNFYTPGKENSIVIVEPLWGMNKPSIIKLACSLWVDLAETGSCRDSELQNEYRSSSRLKQAGIFNCGKSTCWACLQRKTSFLLAEVVDNTRYLYDQPLPSEYIERAWKCRGY